MIISAARNAGYESRGAYARSTSHCRVRRFERLARAPSSRVRGARWRELRPRDAADLFEHARRWAACQKSNCRDQRHALEPRFGDAEQARRALGGAYRRAVGGRGTPRIRLL
jgi:hypothetical protein